jgi:hypothetical protein
MLAFLDSKPLALICCVSLDCVSDFYSLPSLFPSTYLSSLLKAVSIFVVPMKALRFLRSYIV